MAFKKIKWGIVGFALWQAAVLWYKDKNLQKKVAKAPTFGQKAKAFFDGRVGTNKEMLEDAKHFDYEGTWEDVKAFFQKEVKMLETKLEELETKVAEWKEKANTAAHNKAEEISATVQTHLDSLQEKLKGRRDDINEKYQVEEKVNVLKKQYEKLKDQLD